MSDADETHRDEFDKTIKMLRANGVRHGRITTKAGVLLDVEFDPSVFIVHVPDAKPERPKPHNPFFEE